jgi:hypothetical protein
VPLAIEAVRRIDAIFEIERELIGRSAAQRLAAQQAQVEPLVVGLERWMRGELGRLSRHADVAEAMDYIPGFDRADTVFSLRDVAVEIGVVDRVILDMHRHALVRGIERGASLDGPAPQNATMLEPKVPVQSRSLCIVLLHDEHSRPFARRQLAWRRLRGNTEIALGRVDADRGIAGRDRLSHPETIAEPARRSPENPAPSVGSAAGR